MSRCRCTDIKTAEGELAILDGADDIVARMQEKLSETDEAAQALKNAVESGADVPLGGVSADLFSKAGSEAPSSAISSIAARRGELEEILAQCQTEDSDYHEAVRLERQRRQEELERQRQALYPKNQNGW